MLCTVYCALRTVYASFVNCLTHSSVVVRDAVAQPLVRHYTADSRSRVQTTFRTLCAVAPMRFP